jgi:hypothetical protein
MFKKILCPEINYSDFLAIIKYALIGGIIAGIYGIIHDQLTFAMAPEYFTKVKFQQFDYVNVGFSNRIFVSIIGFLATGVVGVFVGWFLGRRYIPNQEISTANKKIKKGFVFVILSSACCATIAFLYGYIAKPDPHLEFWSNTFEFYSIIDGWNFVRVAYIHYGSYAGGLFGLIGTFIFIKLQK